MLYSGWRTGLTISLALIGVATGCKEKTQPPSWISTKQELTLLSANDGQAHLRLDSDMKIDKKNVTKDSITVMHLGPDHPPIVRTVYDTVPNTIMGAPYIAMTDDGRYGFVTCHGMGIFSPEEPKDLLSVIDLSLPNLPVVQKIQVPTPLMPSIHPDGKHVIVACATGFQVFEMRGGQLVLERDNEINVIPLSMAISPKGDRIVAALLKDGEMFADGVHVFSYRDGVIAHLHEVKVRSGLSRFDAPFSLRFSPDGKRVLVPNGGGFGSKGRLDDVLSIDMTLDPPTVTEVIPQVADGIESLAFHPRGHMAVISCLEDIPPMAHNTYSHLAVIDLTSQPARLLYHVNVEAIPEGIEFTPDGSQLFVQLTSANHIAVFDVDGFLLKRSPFVIRVGHGPASMALGRRYMK